jgi:hypothetical protein
MRASSPKMLVSAAALAAIGAGLAFVCARGLIFNDPDPVRPAPAALHEPAWPAPQVVTPPVSTVESRPVERPAAPVDPQRPVGALDQLLPQGMGAIPGLQQMNPEQGRATADTAGQLLNGFLGQGRTDGAPRPMQIPQMTPDQAAAAARTATDLINGMLANGGQPRPGQNGAPAQLDPNQAAAAAQSAAKMLNGMFQSRGLAPAPKDSAGDAAPIDLDQPVPSPESSSASAAPVYGEHKRGNDVRIDPKAVKDALRALGR